MAARTPAAGGQLPAGSAMALVLFPEAAELLSRESSGGDLARQLVRDIAQDGEGCIEMFVTRVTIGRIEPGNRRDGELGRRGLLEARTAGFLPDGRTMSAAVAARSRPVVPWPAVLVVPDGAVELLSQDSPQGVAARRLVRQAAVHGRDAGVGVAVSPEAAERIGCLTTRARSSSAPRQH
jgi:hypothetical protein